ncbi:MAG: NlpC/P60 family protein [Bacteroidales bacterium]|nr:NlpC/P60 family protein [Bacteroidales bacterium]
MRNKRKYLIFKLVPMLFAMVLALSACHTKKSASATTTHYPTRRPVRVSDEWKTLNITLTSRDNKLLYKEIKSWLGAPYRYGGNTRNGVDCSGFVHQIYKTVYKQKIQRNSAKIFEKNCRMIDVDDLEEGDLLFYKTSKKNDRITHVGIYLKENKFAHASSSRGVVISDITEEYFINHFYAAGRVER